MKNRIGIISKYFIRGLLFLLISILIEIFVFNFKILILSNDEKGEIELLEYNINEDNNETIININLDSIYVNKLRLKYATDDDVNVTINYDYIGSYDKETSDSLNDILDNEVSEEIINLKKKINNIKIQYDSEDAIKIEKISVDNKLNISIFRIIFLFSIFVMIAILIDFFKNGSKTEKLHKCFLAIGLTIGSVLIIIQPSTTYYSWDDQIHFKNVYELVSGNFNWKIGEFSMIDSTPVGRNSIDSMEEQFNQTEYLNQDILSSYTSYSGRFITYNKIAYIPSSIGFYLGRILKLPFTICFKMGKFMNLLVYLLIMSYAIKITKIGKRLLTMLGLIPTSIFLSCQYSYDPAVIAGITLSFVCIINLFVGKNSKVDFKTIFIIIFAMLYGTFTKAIYIPLILLFLLVPNDRFKSNKQAVIVKIGVSLLCLLMLYTFIFPTVSSSDVAGDSRGGDTSVSEQLKLIINYPLDYLVVLKNTALSLFSARTFSKDIFGNYAYMGKISDNLYYLFFISLLFVAATDTQKEKLTKINKLLLLLLIIGIIILIWTALYLSYTPVGLNTINGVQARYFIPLLFPLIICFQSSKIKNNISDKVYNILVIAIPAFVLMVSLYNVILINYCI